MIENFPKCFEPYLFSKSLWYFLLHALVHWQFYKYTKHKGSGRIVNVISFVELHCPILKQLGTTVLGPIECYVYI